MSNKIIGVGMFIPIRTTTNIMIISITLFLKLLVLSMIRRQDNGKNFYCSAFQISQYPLNHYYKYYYPTVITNNIIINSNIKSRSISTTTTTTFLKYHQPNNHNNYNIKKNTNSNIICCFSTNDKNNEIKNRNTMIFVDKSDTTQQTTTATTTTTETTAFDETVMMKTKNWDSIQQQVVNECKEILDCFTIASKTVLTSMFSVNKTIAVQDIIEVCDELESLPTSSKHSSIIDESFSVTEFLKLRQATLEFRRYELLVQLMKQDYEAYIATASFLSPNRIPRKKLPNVQDVPYSTSRTVISSSTPPDNEMQLVADCELESVTFKETPLDALLLFIFRKLVTKFTGGITSEKKGIEGLLDQGRTYMLLPNQTAGAQHKMVYQTLGGLMTPALPPFYRVFMSGIVPSIGSPWDGKQLGPWFYAPFLTSFVTPTFFSFLVGPSTINRRKDGSFGGLVVEKCKFLQESNCKGLCLNQCKIPAQEFFENELGLPLTVSPNFVTQECQWSFGETPLPPDQDPSFPKGCLAGCESRKLISASGASTKSSSATLCM